MRDAKGRFVAGVARPHRRKCACDVPVGRGCARCSYRRDYERNGPRRLAAARRARRGVPVVLDASVSLYRAEKERRRGAA